MIPWEKVVELTSRRMQLFFLYRKFFYSSLSFEKLLSHTAFMIKHVKILGPEITCTQILQSKTKATPDNAIRTIWISSKELINSSFISGI